MSASDLTGGAVEHRRKLAPSIASFSSKRSVPLPYVQGQGHDPRPGPGAQDGSLPSGFKHWTSGSLTTGPQRLAI